MGKRDRQGREIKKQKKQPTKAAIMHPGSELVIVPPVEVVKRKRKHPDEEEAE